MLEDPKKKSFFEVGSVLNPKIKALFYFLLGPLMSLSGLFYKYFLSSRKGSVKVHLGPGKLKYKYISGWVNLDANIFTGKCDVWVDLRNKLPFFSSSVDCFYSYHVVEHLPDLRKHFEDVFRCLRPGGVYRFGGPNGDSAVKKFINQDYAWFIDFPDNRKSIGGRFENFIFCRGEHLTILTYSYMLELLKEAGFVDIRKCNPVKESFFLEKFSSCLSTEMENDFDDPHTLIIYKT
jgi:predicted SAM-dependent methyltransferase